MPRLPSNPLRRFRRNRQANNSAGVVEPETIAATITAIGNSCGGCCHICGCLGAKSYRKHCNDDDGSVLTADTTLSGASFLNVPYRDEVSPCEDIGYIIGDAAVCLLDGFATIMHCCDGMMAKPVKSERSFCVTWGPDEVFHLDEALKTTQTANKTRILETKDDDLIADEGKINNRNNQADDTSKASVQSVHLNTGWQSFESEEFKVTPDGVNAWKNDEPEHAEPEQQMIEAAFEANFSDLSSFVNTTEFNIEDASVQLPNTTATGTPSRDGPSRDGGKKPRSCACCGKSNKKDNPIKLKICSRCKTTYYCSAECQKLDWHFDHKNKCRPQILL
ncbi:hypothetical protein HJC23_007467 [Cyclotella cryptica]|uniref:MYND-type domain-containing protein n=1 Tax=Cyclotella cryptica TaxID=29204 RepID=A0ABD3NSE7_9STRA|eukprot:CCRYP_020099-RA/>CCRYP_020099-RA protein AED:0.16 eAED:0.16 QI:0/-1/0/1/-1/1/1/0/333